MKAYQQIKIVECGEPLLPIPLDNFIVEKPSPYEKLGANYQGKSPYYLRQSVLESLIKASQKLRQIKPNWQIKIFDAYRPVEVQKYMVNYTFELICKNKQLDLDKLTPKQRENIYQQVYTIWAIPSDNPDTPPPHSTGGAVDITLVDHQGNIVDMGGEIDELSARSQPNYYANSETLKEQNYHQNRELLNQIMNSFEFRRHLGEWWHFCLGDQMWAWLCNQENSQQNLVAKYGRVDIS